jgi:preprotein translocase subunit SecA
MGLLDRILRAGDSKKVKDLAGIVPEVNALEAGMKALTDDALRYKTVEFRERLAKGESLDDLMIEAFAVVREGALRSIGQRHYDVQLMGGAALHVGWVSEMKTGEGKTLVSTLPLYLNGLTGRGAHLITVNDYLAKFHAEWMGRIHNFLGLTVGLVIPDFRDSAVEKRDAYACDITYGTNNEFGFDYLRDNMATSPEEKVQRKHVYAVVDEVDSILIDEARTPLIISGRLADAAKLYYQFASIVRSLKRDEDYEVDEEKRNIAPLEPGIEKVEKALGIENMYEAVQQNLVHQLTAAIKAKELFKRDKDYIVQGGEVKIVDEFTGRILEGRRWSEGLHQAVEAKEGVKIKEENQTLATITLQNYFRMYEKLAGMTGTAQTEAAELKNTYGLDVVPIPTNRALARLDEADLIYKTEKAKYEAVVEDITARYEAGQPVLVGTISVEKSEMLSRQLTKRGIKHEVLNAKQHAREALVVAQAGRRSGITVATNMAGRGVDILLGGNPELLARDETVKEGLEGEAAEARYQELIGPFTERCKAEGEEVRELGGLYVLGTERHESRRIDNQLRGRAGRQGDPGESRFYLSLDDELMRLFATGAMSWVMGKALPDDMPIEAKMVSRAIEKAQSTVEQRNAEIRKDVLKYDEVMNEQRKVIYKRRDQILEGRDLRDEAHEYLADAVHTTVQTHCVSRADDEWNVEGLLADVNGYYPTAVTEADVMACGDTEEISDKVLAEAEAFYAKREEELTPELMREIERQVMLRIIDQRWLEHLADMDYLQEGINLRAMGQKDPLVEWQREGFEHFGRLMHTIAQDFVRYVMHVEVVEEQPEAPQLQNVTYTAPDDSLPSAMAATAATMPDDGDDDVTSTAAQVAAELEPEPMKPIVKTEQEKVGRNDPCYCGSGKKFKNCHGK